MILTSNYDTKHCSCPHIIYILHLPQTSYPDDIRFSLKIVLIEKSRLTVSKRTMPHDRLYAMIYGVIWYNDNVSDHVVVLRILILNLTSLMFWFSYKTSNIWSDCAQWRLLADMKWSMTFRITLINFEDVNLV